jgi:hypothetical protein
MLVKEINDFGNLQNNPESLRSRDFAPLSN